MNANNDEADYVRPDKALTEILIRMIPKPGEVRVLTFCDGKPDLYMSPEAAAAWLEMRDRINELHAEHGEERTMEIYDASVVVAHVNWRYRDE